MRREQFLTRAGAIALAPAGLAELAQAQTAATRWDGVRAAFALDPTKRNLTTFVFAPHPAPVRAAIAKHRRGLDSNAIGYLHAHEDELDARVLAAAAKYLAADPDELALTDSTTMGLALVYTGFDLRAGDEVLTSEHDFYATHESLRFAAERTGAVVKRTRLYGRPDRASADEIVSSVTDAITPRTRVVALTWVHSSTGVKLPVRAIARAVAEQNRKRDAARRIVVAIDGVHALGVEAAHPSQLGIDFLIAGTHKWLFGPRGTGIVWGNAAAWSHVRSTIPTFDGRAYGAWLFDRPVAIPPGPRLTPGGYKAFEHRWAAAEAFRFHLEIGRDQIEKHTHALATRLKRGLAEIRPVSLVTPMSSDLSAGIVCFTHARRSAEDVVSALARRGVVASVTPYRERYVRLGPSIANSEADVDAALKAIRALA
jgi:selenocysteine lyase/cysteine desulfurase